jgi:hypothetical protein
VEEVTMLGHISFGVADLAYSAEFCDAILAPLGYVRVGQGNTPLADASKLEAVHQ